MGLSLVGAPRRRTRVDAPRDVGQGLVEFALIFPVIALLLLGLFDLGRAVYAYNTIGNAARQGARVAAVNQILTSPDCSNQKPIEDPADPHWSITTCAASIATSLNVSPADVSVQFQAPPGATTSCSPAINIGCIASVTVHYVFSPITPIIGSMFPSIPMESTAQMSIERVFP